MPTLYHSVSSRSFRPLWALEELGLKYELKMLGFPPRAVAPAYLDENPLGTVPLFIDGAVRMSESAAICEYLAARNLPNSLHVAPDEPDFGAYLNYLHFGETTLTWPQAIALRFTRFEPDERKNPQLASDYQRWFLSRLRTLEPLLSRQDHVCAKGFTAADISVGYALMLANLIGFADKFKPAVQAYWQRLQAREGFQRALAVEDKAARAQGVDPTPAPLAGSTPAV
ncbi:MAG: glutathione S-transferase family protein [Burkholderiaceae bacterium]|nr:glutathione S-transferase family protein [Burkholderiaceae bacterium]